MNYLIISLSTSVALAILVLVLKMRKAYRDKQSVAQQIERLRAYLESISQSLFNSNVFIRYSQVKESRTKVLEIFDHVSKLKNHYLKLEIANLKDDANSFLLDLDRNRLNHNQQFIKAEREKARSVLFDANGNALLTEEQMEAVLIDDDRNLIIAGAGSGKTRVIDFKVRYLVKVKEVDPGRIILLSFSSKSAKDLASKIGDNVKGVEARTIHSFAFQLVGKQGKKLFNNDQNEFGALVIHSLVEALSKNASAFWSFYRDFFVEVKPLIFYNDLRALREDLKKANSQVTYVPTDVDQYRFNRAFKTLKGEYVRSIDERYIADFLFLQNVDYIYENPYPHIHNYFPDFYLTKEQIYLEHFAITENGNPPSYFQNPDAYLKGIEWKREVHKKNNTKMIESFSYLLNREGNASAYLTDLFRKSGIKIDDSLNDEKTFSILSRNFNQLFTKFYNRFKLSGLTLEGISERFDGRKYQAFLKIFKPFLEILDRRIAESQKIDFTDMLLLAIDKMKSGGEESYEYIIVDEFQDTSKLAMDLLNLIYQNSKNASFITVGDDWQSIYGFNGSDVEILSLYNQTYEGVSTSYLNNNFRSHSRIVELGKNFISRNPAQLQKNVVSKNTAFTDSIIDFITFKQMEEIIEKIPADESIFVLYRYNEDCPEGIGKFRNFYSDRRHNGSKNISLMTIHASKGLEARHVFILFPNGVSRKFPSEIEDHFVFDMLNTKSENFPFSEERRLMYVAITRAEQNLYFVSPRGNSNPNSVFWDELKEMV